MTEPQRARVEINWVQVSASALAAVSSAVLLSTVGVAGTLIGAAIGSIFATVGSSIYSHYLELSRSRVAAAQAAARERATRTRSSASGTWAATRRARARSERTMRLQAQREERANDELDQVEQQLADPEDAATKPSWREALAGLNWKRIAALAAAIFVGAMLIIVSFELVTGRAVSSYTGGSNGNPRTSIPGLGGGQSTGTPTGTGTPTPTP